MITSLNIPRSAGEGYNGTGVRHISPVDVIDSTSLSTTSKNLAYRDYIIAAKVNEIVRALNESPSNQPTLAFPPVRIMPGEHLRLGNLRINSGYTAIVKVMSFSKSPSTADCTANVQHSTGFGEDTGTLVASLSSSGDLETASAAQPEGELIFSVLNTSAIAVTVTVSATVTIAEA